MENSIVLRELVNGSLTVINVCVLFILLKYLWTYHDSKTWRPWRQTNDVKLVIALTTYFVGTTTRSVYVWFLLATKNAEATDVSAAIDHFWHFLIFGTAITIWGGLCIMNVFMPETTWSQRWWIFVGLSAITLPFVFSSFLNWLF